MISGSNIRSVDDFIDHLEVGGVPSNYKTRMSEQKRNLTNKGKTTMQNQNNAPLDKGRVSVIVEKYQTNQVNQQTGQPIMKNRYATIGRATLWPNQPNSNMPNVEVELDSMPIGHAGKLKLYIFWDSENQNNQSQVPAPQQAPQRWPNNQNQQR